MTTGPKLVAALLLAGLAWFATGLVIGELPDGTPAGLLPHVNTLIGFVVGWRVLGPHAAAGLGTVFSFGLTSSFALTFWCILVWAGYEMMERAWKRAYETPIEALQGMADLMVEYTRVIVTPEIITTLVLGGIMTALISKASSRFIS